MSAPATTEYRDVIERYIEGFNQQNLEILQETVNPDVVVHGLIGVEGNVNGIEEYGDWAMEMLTGIPDARIDLEDLFINEDKVAARWTVSGTQENELFGLPATGESVEVPGLAIFRMEDGKIAEKWYQQDDLGMLQQSGVVEGL